MEGPPLTLELTLTLVKTPFFGRVTLTLVRNVFLTCFITLCLFVQGIQSGPWQD